MRISRITFPTQFNYRSIARQITFLFTISLGTIVGCLPTEASSAVSISPAFQTVQLLSNGDPAKISIRVMNTTDSAQTFELRVADIQQLDAQGNIALIEKPLQGNTLALASYIQASPSALIVPSHTEQKVELTVVNSPDLSPGGHYAAVIVQGKDQLRAGGQTIVPALTSFVLVHKSGGEIYHLSLSEIPEFIPSVRFRHPSEATMLFHNEGNSHLSPFGTIQVSDLFSRIVSKTIVNEGGKIVLPQGDREFKEKMRFSQTFFSVMLYRVQVQGTSKPADIHFLQDSTYLYISPAGLGIFLLVTVGILFLLKKNRKKL